MHFFGLYLREPRQFRALSCHCSYIILYNIPVKFWKYDVCDGVNEQKKLELGASLVWLVVQLIFYVSGSQSVYVSFL